MYKIVCAHCGQTQSQGCECTWWIEHMLSLGLTPSRKKFEWAGNRMEIVR